MIHPPDILRAGMIGLDTSHAPAFIRMLNQTERDEEHERRFGGVRVVAAYPQGSREIVSSVERVPKYTEEARQCGVEIVSSIDTLLSDVDVVFLESNDGRVHLEQILPALAAGKPVFVDKPVGHDLRTVLKIYDEAERHQVPIFSSSVLRFGALTLEAKKLGSEAFSRVYAHSPGKIEPTHNDLFWYGIHGCEVLFTLLGAEVKTVRRQTDEEGLIHVVGTWANGALGEYYESNTKRRKNFGGMAFAGEKSMRVGDLHGYSPLLERIVEFFKTGVPPVSCNETIALYAYMSAADESKRQGGQEIDITSWMTANR